MLAFFIYIIIVQKSSKTRNVRLIHLYIQTLKEIFSKDPSLTFKIFSNIFNFLVCVVIYLRLINFLPLPFVFIISYDFSL